MYGRSTLGVGSTLVIGGVGFVPQGEDLGVALDPLCFLLYQVTHDLGFAFAR